VQFDLGIGAALVTGFPLLLLGFIWFMGRLESWMLVPDERAAAVVELLEQVDEAEDLERAVTSMMAGVPPAQTVGRRRRGALRLIRGRRSASSTAD
jgi:Na+-transporting methylmalonyl-CoA/oxaloacetate decarboxylase gamma subunit